MVCFMLHVLKIMFVKSVILPQFVKNHDFHKTSVLIIICTLTLAHFNQEPKQLNLEVETHFPFSRMFALGK